MTPNRRFLLAGCLLAACAALTPADGGTLYGGDPFENQSGIATDFFIIDLATGARTVIGSNSEAMDIRGGTGGQPFSWGG